MGGHPRKLFYQNDLATADGVTTHGRPRRSNGQNCSHIDQENRFDDTFGRAWRRTFYVDTQCYAPVGFPPAGEKPILSSQHFLC